MAKKKLYTNEHKEVFPFPNSSLEGEQVFQGWLVIELDSLDWTPMLLPFSSNTLSTRRTDRF
jgi:hypothetical protein